jgi:hypothetical protein
VRTTGPPATGVSPNPLVGLMRRIGNADVASRDASGSCFDDNPAPDSTDHPLPMCGLRSRELLEPPIRKASAPQTEPPDETRVGEKSKIWRFSMITNISCQGDSHAPSNASVQIRF